MMRLKLLGASGLRVSELCLGTMTFGTDWGWGADEATSRAIFERFVAEGGNFIDTANNYTNGASERFVGGLIAAERDRYVVATKYTLRNTALDAHDANGGGNSRKSMARSVERSLQALRTDYIDLLYLHMWDETTPVDEVLRAADDMVRAGKLLYFAFSDTPAWVVSYAVARAEAMGWTRPVAIQAPYSLFRRDIEREIAPMAQALDLALIPWGVLGGGALTGKYSRQGDEPRREDSVSAAYLAAGEAVARVAAEVGCTPAQAALVWVRQQPGLVIPLLGCRTLAQLEDNLGCLEVVLPAPQREALDSVVDFTPGFPTSFLHSAHVRNLIFGDSFARLDQQRRRV
jgi:aryl-alcohol dehydrogenase-like predicted oxidoreductase